jgi:transcriptional regulator with XRE-family HTH domain
MPRPRSSVSARIRARRLELDLSQREAADRAGLLQQHWARLEAEGGRADAGTWSVALAARVARALGLPLGELAGA